MRRLSGMAAFRRPCGMAALRRPCGTALLVAAALAAFAVIPGRPAAPGVTSRAHSARPQPPGGSVLASLPLAFEPAGPDGFVSRGPGYALALTLAEAEVAVDGGSFRLRPAGRVVNPAGRLVGRDPLPGTVTRLQGDDAARWSPGVSTYAAVVAQDVWPGVDMVWHGNQRRLEHDMVVAPGADPSVVALDVEGARNLSIDAGGDLVIDLDGATARLARPTLYQDVAGERRSVTGRFDLLGPARIGFRIGAYDTRLPLVIDPTLLTSTYLGGAGADSGYGIGRDRSGNTYVVGSTESTDFPTSSPFQRSLAPAAVSGGTTSDVFVAKLNPAGTALVWSTYLGGRGRDTGYSVAVGADGAVYVAGVTESSDFPRAKAGQNNYGGGPSDAFVAKLAPDGASLEWSTFLGGNQSDRARGLATDANGDAYVTGSTGSVDFPAVSAQQSGPYRPDDVDAFVAKLPSAGGPVMYSTRLGGSNDDNGVAVAVDAQGGAFVTGDTLSPGFPTVRPLQAGSGGSASGVAGSFPDAFVAKYSPSGTALVYSTFLGGSDFDQGTAIAVDSAGAAHVTGNTNSPNFPVVGAVQSRKDGDSDVFVAKLDPPGAALVYSTYYGGAGADGGNGIAVDGAGSAVVVGTTGSSNWPVSRPVQAAKSGGSDAFVLTLNAGGNVAQFSTFFGGREEDQGIGVAVDAQGTVHVLGLTASADFPTAKPFQVARAAAGDAFVASLSVADAAAPVGASPAPAPVSSSSSGHDRRVRALGLLTLALLLGATVQTVYLRRRRPAPAPPGRGRPDAASAPWVLDDPDLTVASGYLGPAGPGATSGAAARSAAGARTGSSKTGSSKAGPSKTGPSRTGRTPKARGGPKGAQPGAGATFPAPASVPPFALSGEVDLDAGGEPTVASSPVLPPPPPPVHEPAIAQLLEEDLWRSEPGPPRVAPPGQWERLADDRSGEVEAVEVEEQGSLPETVSQSAGSAWDDAPEPVIPAADAPPPIPPVPAEDLSFWDLFPEDLPPVRAGGFQVDDVGADPPALPPIEDLLAGTPAQSDRPRFDPIQGDPPMLDAPWPDDQPPPALPPMDAEIVIAELLDGPLPAGRRASTEPGRRAEKDVVVSDLLFDDPSPAGPGGADDEVGADGDHDHSDGDDDGDGDGDQTSARLGVEKSPEEMARIAADQARRRRSRRSGRRKRRNPGDSG